MESALILCASNKVYRTAIIINGVSGLRNNFSDSHGTAPSKTTYKIDKRHAILTVNLAKTISEYLFLSYENQNNRVTNANN